MDGKKRVLFVCVHNSARSQMAAAFLKRLAGDRFEVESAGLEPGRLNPLAVEAMRETGIDISRNRTTGILELLEAGRSYDYVVTVCDASRTESCPVFPGRQVARLHWSFEDPSAFEGTESEKLQKTRIVRDQIKKQVIAWLHEVGNRG